MPDEITDALPPPTAPAANRATGVLRAHFVATAGRTAPSRLFQGGGLRLRCPRVGPGLHPDCEAVTINTAGGMVGGDSATLDFAAGPGAAVTLTTQSAEKIYRSTGTPTRVATRLTLASGSTLEWLPQETILFDGTDFRRQLEVDMAADATLLVAEALVFGRLAMGEQVRTGTLRDRWRIRRGGALAFAEAVALGPDIATQLESPALGGGARAVATLLLVSPEAEGRCDRIRAALAPFDGAAASAWNGLLVVRLLSPSPATVRAAMVAALAALRGRAAPRVWQ